MRGRITAFALTVLVGITVWRISVAGVTTGPVTGGHRVLPAGPVTVFAVMITGIPLAYWVTGKLLGRSWRR